jgi:predicted dehydrogenase
MRIAGERLQAQDAHFVDVVRGDKPQGYKPEDAADVLEAAEQAQAMLERVEVSA